MALLSTKGVYGLMAMIEIAKASEVAPVSIKEISQKTGISKNYLEQILNLLRSAELIISIKGKNGGYYMKKTTDQISFSEIFKAMEKDYKMVNIEVTDQNINYFFQKCDEKLFEIFDMPLSKFDDYKQENAKFLDFVI